jgi:hypothetical protein
LLEDPRCRSLEEYVNTKNIFKNNKKTSHPEDTVVIKFVWDNEEAIEQQPQ